jgi:hypothetical protein
MIFDEAPKGKRPIQPTNEGLNLLVGLCALIVLTVGIYPAPLANLCLKVATILL